MPLSKLSQLLKLISTVLLCEAAGIIGSIFTVPAIPNWYESLTKPPFTPPPWVFGPVWVVLYLLMGISAWLVWRKLDSRFRSPRYGFDEAGENDDTDQGDKKNIKKALTMFLIQLILNAVWPIIFFGLMSPGWGLVELTVLLAVVLLTAMTFYRISRLAAFLLVPYILWLMFAFSINFAIWTA